MNYEQAHNKVADILYNISLKGGTANKIEEMEAMDIALNSIRKQIPYEPLGVVYNQMRCPNCHKRIRSGIGTSSQYKRDYYCQKCGQRIDWSDKVIRRLTQ